MKAATTKGAGRGSTAAGAASRADLPADPGRHAAKLRAQGADGVAVRKALTDMGYPAATVANVAPGDPTARELHQGNPPASRPVAPPRSSTTAAPASSNPRPAWTLPGGSGDLSGFVLGLLGTAVLVNFMRGGPAGVKRWMSAKFLNRPGPAPATPGSSGKSALPGAGAPRPPGRGLVYGGNGRLVPAPGSSPAGGGSGFGSGGGGGGSF